jgi:hexosaminidase
LAVLIKDPFMRKTRTLFFFLFFHYFIQAQDVSIIPEPASLKVKRGTFSISTNTYCLALGSGMDNSVNFLNGYLKNYYGFQLKKETRPRLLNVIMLNFERMDNSVPGAYTMEIGKDNIQINADNEEGVFYAIQSLIQLFPPERKNVITVPQLSIVDSPRFAYRGMHLDVSRHFFPVSYIKKYIDYIALHKMNYFHWHLTDDQGWRIEIKKYPKLTQVGGWRDGTIIGRYPGTGNDRRRYGGFYTQEQVKEVVDYAARRYITVIPEIEMPGHSLAALAAYPQLGTTPDSVSIVGQTWGINNRYNNVLNPSDYTFNFFQDVLDEVMKLFPAPYIHIGGDECSKIWWHKSSFCQQLIKEKGLKDEHALQSYFIQRIEKYVNSKGKKIIGWDEILEGGLAPNATVMSWRGEQGGIDAAKQKHPVIMTPETPVYFDHSQSQLEDSITIGGYNSLGKVYDYEPIPKELNDEEAGYVLGAQGNVWTEYIGNVRKLEYMIFPRMSALSEVLWTPVEKKSWNNFERKLMVQFRRYDLWKSNYSVAYYDLIPSIQPVTNFEGIQLKLESKLKEADITVYKVNRKDTLALGLYKKPLIIKESGLYVADFSVNHMLISKYKQLFSFNMATGKQITLAYPPSPNFPGDGAFTLVNGVINTKGYARATEFVGFSGTNCEAVIDLGTIKTISKVVVNALRRESNWIYAPQGVELFGSLDGLKYYSIKETSAFVEKENGKGTMTMTFNGTYTRYVKVVVKNRGSIPEGSPGSGNKAWLLVDEIEVN